MDIKETYPLLAEIVETLDLNILGRQPRNTFFTSGWILKPTKKYLESHL